jgi:hypothetical protein
MPVRLVAIALLFFFLISTLPAIASITVLNKTPYRLDIVLTDTRRRQNECINPDERLSFRCSESGGQLIVLKKQEEQAKKRFDDGDKFIIKCVDDKIVIVEVRDF